MKKTLEADLMSIAHRILQLKDKSDVNQLFAETQKLYEKLAILRFVENHFNGVQPTIGKQEMASLLETTFLEKETFPKNENQEVETDTTFLKADTNSALDVLSITDEAQEVVTTQENVIVEEVTTFEKTAIVSDFNSEVANLEGEKTSQTVQISFSDLLGSDYTEPEFVKVSDKTNTSEMEPITKTPRSLNDILSKSIEIDLNDRLAFVKHLFNNSNEDYNRVLSQLNTFESFFEAKSFIDEIVQPDYNHWKGKEEYVARFFEILEKKFL